MQTFCPYPDAAKSAATLDLARLGKQIIECRQIGRAITDPSYGWQSHPAVNMWRGKLGGLMTYAVAMNDEWFVRRGKEHQAALNMLDDHAQPASYEMPLWWGDPAVHESHRSNLLRKAPAHYRQFWPYMPDNLEYVWPT